MTFLRSLWSWLKDFPRPTWEVPTDEGRFVFDRPSYARQCVAAEREADPESDAEVMRGPWMRPSESDALPEL